MIYNLLILSGLFLVVFAMGEIAYRTMGVPAEYTRKWSHIASGFLSLLFPYFFDSLLWVGIICGLFALVLNVSKYLDILPSINRVARHTYGSVLFPVAVFVSYAAYVYFDKDILYFYLPVLTLAICDLCAALVGKRFPIMKVRSLKEPKSLGGFMAFSISAILIYSIFLYFGFDISILVILLVPVCVAAVELISPKGFDNITIPVSVILGLIILN